ncbi:unnamed protein product, partial [Amoebophrya sp. A120]|eukprot:GSA120T00015709001.1
MKGGKSNAKTFSSSSSKPKAAKGCSTKGNNKTRTGNKNNIFAAGSGTTSVAPPPQLEQSRPSSQLVHQLEHENLEDNFESTTEQRYQRLNLENRNRAHFEEKEQKQMVKKPVQFRWTDKQKMMAKARMHEKFWYKMIYP